MRKNQYEEALFKCEDERFEIDMVIDCNSNTLRLLEPLAEELALFAKASTANLSTGSTGAAGSTGGAANSASGTNTNTSATNTTGTCRILYNCCP